MEERSSLMDYEGIQEEIKQQPSLNNVRPSQNQIEPSQADEDINIVVQAA